MDNVFTRSLDRFLGRGDASIAIPPMDGALKPNSAIDEAEHLLSRIARPDNLIARGTACCSRPSGSFWPPAAIGPSLTPVVECEGEILATASAADGTIAIFDQARGLSLLNISKRSMIRRNLAALAARLRDRRGLPRSRETLIVCVGSTKNTARELAARLVGIGGGRIGVVDRPSQLRHDPARRKSALSGGMPRPGRRT